MSTGEDSNDISERQQEDGYVRNGSFFDCWPEIIINLNKSTVADRMRVFEDFGIASQMQDSEC